MYTSSRGGGERDEFRSPRVRVEGKALFGGGAKLGLAGSANGWREVEVEVDVSG